MSLQSKLQKIRNQIYEFRQRTLGFPVLHKAFFKHHGYPLNLKNPTSHCERINHKKIYDRDPLIPITSDKYRVREYVRQKLGNELAEKILIPLYQVSKTGLDIPFEDWDFEFFMKANHYSGGNLLVTPGTNPKILRDVCRTWLNSSFGQNLHEWGYRDIPRMIICEKVIRDPKGNLPNDYKFYCFQGKVEMIGIVKDRFEGLKTTFTDPFLNPLGGPVGSDTLLNEIPEIPNFQFMISISEALSKDFSHVRIDLYSFENHVHFGEITHYPGSGLDKYDSFELDLELGRKWTKQKDLQEHPIK